MAPALERWWPRALLDTRTEQIGFLFRRKLCWKGTWRSIRQGMQHEHSSLRLNNGLRSERFWLMLRKWL